MSQTYGVEFPAPHHRLPLRQPARYLVIVQASDQSTALLFSDTREPLGEFAAGTEEVAVMVRSRTPTRTATAPEWDEALGHYSAAERADAEVYTLDL